MIDSGEKNYFKFNTCTTGMINSSESPNEAYEHLLDTNCDRICIYRADHGRVLEPHSKGVVQYVGYKVTYYGLFSHHQNKFIVIRTK